MLLGHPGVEMEEYPLRPDAFDQCIGEDHVKAAEVEAAMAEVDEGEEEDLYLFIQEYYWGA
ncbi:hypothetical protein F3Y22_tig00110963pilonHSYRG00103 [Hibiscus syriacus]|uniref:Uncharacterized protein n=1 Tax=Hibiscus syriacus TaxID=106335 RepID=A0A6A2ZA43_HIBSY|nr:hypothetical protein F3Y22_tig00110963pilonHSYRG00103 [Hibiscus syriacus]